jgi:hypothetical protein
MKHRADTLEPMTTAPEGTPSAKHALPEDQAPGGALPDHLIPANATWKSRRLGRTLLSVLTAAALVAVVPAAAYYWQMRTDERMKVLVAVAMLAMGLWALLASRRPQRVTLHGSLLTVKGRTLTDTFDLADGMQRVELSGDPRKSRWTLTLGRTDSSDVVLTGRDVDAIAVDPIVRHYRDLAERRRAQRWAMLGL